MKKFKEYFIMHWKGELSLTKAFWINLVIFSISLIFQIMLFYSFLKSIVELFLLPVFIYLIFKCIVLILIAIVLVWQITGVFRCCLKYIKSGKKIKALLTMVTTEFYLLLTIILIINVPKIYKAYKFQDNNRKYSISIVDNSTKIHIVGDFKKGLSKEIKNILKSESDINGIIIDSYGGSGDEGYKLAKLIENNNLNAYVSSICASAGTIAFIAGKERYIDVDAKIGFHYGYGVRDYPKIFNLTRWDIYPFKKPKNKTDRMQFNHIAKFGVSKDFINKLEEHKTIDLLYPSTEELLDSGYIHGIEDIASISNIGVEYRNDYDARVLHHKAIKLSNKGKDELAIKFFTEAIELVENSYIYLNRAVSYKKLQQYDHMIPDLTRALELYEESDNNDIKLYKDILDYRSSAYYILKQFDNTLEDINEIIKIDTLHAAYFFKRADSYSMLDSFSLAQKDYKKAISMDSTRAEYYFGIAVTYYHMKQYAESLADANNYLKYSNPEYKIFGYSIRGRASFELKKFHQAKLDLEKYLSFEQDDNPPYLTLAAINYKLKNFKQAEIYYTKADSLKNNGIDVKWDEDDYEWNSTLLKSILEEWGKL